MQDAAKILARDFGFRAAVATGDQATAASALDNLKRRLNADLAVIVGIDGVGPWRLEPGRARRLAALWAPLDAGRTSGVARIDGQENQVVAAPILTPVLTGWILFASSLDADEMRSLENAFRDPAQCRRDRQARRPMEPRRRGVRVVRPCRVATDRCQPQRPSAASSSTLAGERSIAVAKRLPTIGQGDHGGALAVYLARRERWRPIVRYNGRSPCSGCWGSRSSSWPAGASRGGSANPWRGSMPRQAGWPTATIPKSWSPATTNSRASRPASTT